MPPIEHGDGVDVSGGDVRQDRPADAGTAVRSGSQTTVTSFFEARKVRQRAPSARAKEGASSPKEAQSKPTVRRAAEATKEKDTAPGDELASDSNCAEGQGAEEDSADTAARKSDDNSSAAATDDVDQGVELLQLLFSAPSATQDRATAAATGRGKGAGAAGGKSSAAKVEAGDGGPPDHKDWAWERSCHDGLLTFHDGRKRWYHCTACQYFNDRLYHCKMHYERIHVNNGKSMPRKRKYMDPSGGAPSTVPPPSSVQQPEPKQPRVRQPGDKWLKTMANTTGPSTGFQYQSVHDVVKRDEGAEGAGGHARDSPSDRGVPSPGEEDRRAQEMNLSPNERSLWCWEPGAETVERGMERGKQASTFRVVHIFDSESSLLSPACAPAAQTVPPAAAAAAVVAVARPSAVRPAAPASPMVERRAALAKVNGNAISVEEAGEKNMQWWWHGASGEEEEEGGEGARSAPVKAVAAGGAEGRKGACAMLKVKVEEVEACPAAAAGGWAAMMQASSSVDRSAPSTAPPNNGSSAMDFATILCPGLDGAGRGGAAALVAADAQLVEDTVHRAHPFGRIAGLTEALTSLAAAAAKDAPKEAEAAGEEASRAASPTATTAMAAAALGGMAALASAASAESSRGGSRG
ncbi:hypothetical protein T484DRAFT_1888271, partial [Baffinella frigidus]